MTMPPVRRPAPNRGFSLMEVVVALAVTVIILIGTLTAVDSTKRITRKGLALAEAQQSADFALQELANNLRKTGSGVGRTVAIARQVLTPGATWVATWHNYNTADSATGIWNNNNGGRVFFPVPGTDGITVRFTDGTPSTHICGSDPAGGATTTAWLPSYPYWPTGYPVVGRVYELFPPNPPAGGSCDSVTITVTDNPANDAVDCGLLPEMTACAVPDATICGVFVNIPPQLPVPAAAKCNKYAVTQNPPGSCGSLCSMSPLAFTTSNPNSYWISTEDGTGTIYSAPGVVSSRPVLVSLQGITGQPRIVTTDVEDLQITYLLDSAQPSAGVVPVNGQLGQLPTALNNALPAVAQWRNQMAAVRALQISLVVRTSVTDQTYKSNAYCNAGMAAGLRPLFSRPANATRPAAVAADSDYCDGMRRQLVRQTIFLPNMISSPS